MTSAVSPISEVKQFSAQHPEFSGIVCVTRYINTRRGLVKKNTDFIIEDGKVARKRNLSFAERCTIGFDNFPNKYGTLADVFIDICNKQIGAGDVSITFMVKSVTK